MTTIEELLPIKERYKHRWVAITMVALTDSEAALADDGVEQRPSAEKVGLGHVSCADCHFPYEVVRDLHCDAQP